LPKKGKKEGFLVKKGFLFGERGIFILGGPKKPFLGMFFSFFLF